MTLRTQFSRATPFATTARRDSSFSPLFVCVLPRGVVRPAFCSIQNLPVLIYKSAFPSSGNPSELANKIEETFIKNGFPPQWRFGLYEYPHYHSTSHEILGVFKGSARVRLGGVKTGVEEDVGPGDVMVIPAGVAHESVQSKGGFEMVGAYPAGCNWDMNYGNSQQEKQKAEANIKRVEVPKQDPVYGSKGPLIEHWNEQ